MSTATQRARWPGMAVVLALVVGGCGGNTKRDAGGDAGTPHTGGMITVVGAYEPNSFNVKVPAKQTEANANVMAGLWRGVWRMAPGSQFILNSDLMVSAEMTSTDPQTIVYKINPQAVWSDGVAVNADDFIYVPSRGRRGKDRRG